MDETNPSVGEAPHPVPLSRDELAEASKRLREAADRERYVRAGEFLRKRGDPNDGLHFIVSGAMHFHRPHRGGGQLLFHVGLPGFWFGVGEVPSLGGSRSMLSAEAVAPTVVASIDLPAAEALLASDDLVRRYHLSMLMNRYATMLDFAETGLKPTPEERLATRLLGFARLNTVPAPLPERMELPISQATLSALTGVSRQTVNRAVRHLVEAGALEAVYGGVRIVDFPRLAEAAGEAWLFPAAGGGPQPASRDDDGGARGA